MRRRRRSSAGRRRRGLRRGREARPATVAGLCGFRKALQRGAAGSGSLGRGRGRQAAHRRAARARARRTGGSQRVELMPGVTYERAVQFTPHGPVALHVVTGPRPGGLYGLRPVLSNETVAGPGDRQLDGSADRGGRDERRPSTPTSSPGRPAIRAGSSCATACSPRRRTAAARASASPTTARWTCGAIEFFATWRGFGQRRTAERVQPAARTERHRALHARLGQDDAGAARRRRRRCSRLSRPLRRTPTCRRRSSTCGRAPPRPSRQAARCSWRAARPASGSPTRRRSAPG